MKIRSQLFSLILSSLIFSSCSTLLGIKNPVIVSEEDIIQRAKKYKIPLQDCYELDSNYLLLFLKILQQQPAKRFKDFSQPLQIKYFDTDDGRLQSWHINCYADRGPAVILLGLDWNKQGRMKHFPPLQQAPFDSVLSLKEQLSYMRPLRTTLPVKAEDYDYIVVVYWNMWMGRHSRRIIKAAKKNIRRAGDLRVKLLYANNENLMRGHYYCKFPEGDILKYGIDMKKLVNSPVR